jgi:alpha-amylase
MTFTARGFQVIAAAFALSSVLGWSEVRAETRTAFVHLFEWKWTDIAEECETHLGPKGFAAVQISPAQEHPIVNESVVKFPWWQRYQPVSYKLVSRSGTREELADMISRCNRAGVKVYADVVINHMAGFNVPGTQTTAGSSFDAGNRSYPAVPYGPPDFHGQCDINYDNAGSIRNCWVTGGLPDLTVETEHVRQKIADHMNDLISIGVAGFRIDAAKHMRPEDIGAILAKVDDIGKKIDPNTGQAFHLRVERPYVFLEVIGAGDEPVKPTEYTGLGNVTEFLYGTKVAGKFRDPNQTLSQLKTFPGHPGSADWGLLPSFNAVAFLDNHDNQRGHGNGGWQGDGRIANILTSDYDGNLYNLANVFMLAWPYGYPKVMSSYKWQKDVQFDPSDNKFKDRNDWKGPPAHSDGSTKSVDCNDEWVCEHRWDNIAEMVGFRNFTGQNQADWTVTNWWDNGGDQIAFGRNGKGFVIINKGGGPIVNQQFETGMPAGQYCEVLHADFDRDTDTCSGTTVTVNGAGQATFSVGEGQAAAIHGGAKIGS